MGQNAFQCNQSSNSPRDLLSQEMRIYHWRSDPNYNSFIPRVGFKNAMMQKQQERFAQFLKGQEQKDYLQIYKFRDEVQNMPKISHQQIIVFQKYHCNLLQLQGLLTLEEIVYALHGLLLGYEEIRKMYDKIIVDETCCFVTHEGSLRAWINPNPKKNQIWSGEHGEIMTEGGFPQLIGNILTLTEKMTERTSKINQFFYLIKSALSRTTLANYCFKEARRLINEYCFLNNIQMGKGLSVALEKMRKLNQLQRNSIINSVTNYQNKNEAKQTNMFLSTMQSEDKLIDRRKSLLLKSKSLQTQCLKHSQTMSSLLQDDLKLQSVIQERPQQLSIFSNTAVLNTVSQIIPKHYEFIQPPFNAIQIQNRHSVRLNETQQKVYTPFSQINNNKASTHISEVNKHSSILKNKTPETSFIKSAVFKQQERPKNNSKPSFLDTPVSIVNVLSKKISERRESKHPERQNKQNHKFKKHQQANIMQASILQYIQDEPQKLKQQIQRNDNRHHTCMDRHSIQSINDSQNYWSRPWITTKTITRLISSNDNNSKSLKNSIAQSSDCYNGSIYSGVLTQMGRDVVNIDNGRAKTVRMSRQM